MNPDTTETKHSTAKTRFLHFMGRVMLWSFLLFLIDKIAEKAEWKTWNEFDRDARTFTEDKLQKMFFLSPFTLYGAIRTNSKVAVENVTDHKKVNDNKPPNNILLRDQYSPQRPTHLRDVTIWEKIRTWCRNFWYDAKGNANWFGRIILLLAFIIAIPLTTVKKKNAYNQVKPLGSDLYILNIFLALIYLLLFFFALFLLVKLMMWIAGGITAIFSGIAALGGFFKYLSEELRSELIGGTKKNSERLVGMK